MDFYEKPKTEKTKNPKKNKKIDFFFNLNSDMLKKILSSVKEKEFILLASSSKLIFQKLKKYFPKQEIINFKLKEIILKNFIYFEKNEKKISSTDASILCDFHSFFGISENSKFEIEYWLQDSFTIQRREYLQKERKMSEFYFGINIFSWNLLCRVAIRFHFGQLKEVLIFWGRLYYSDIIKHKKKFRIPVEFQRRTQEPLVASENCLIS